MPRWCVVPNCSVHLEKRYVSVFNVPKDANQYQQWVAAIPGIVTLKPTHSVCSKHFNEADIIREWIKRDSNGRVIARASYKRPRLRKFAVPSKFDDLSTTKDCTVLLSSSATRFDDLSTTKDCAVLSSSSATRFDDLSTTKDCAVLSSSSATRFDDLSTTKDCAIPSSSSATKLQNISDNTTDFMTDPIQFIDCSIKESSAETATSCNFALPITDSTELVLPIKLADTINTIELTDSLVTAPVVLKEPITICSPVTTRKYVESEIDRIYQEISGKLPKYWSVSKMPVTSEQSILFNYVITPIENGKRLPILQKCVILNSDRKLHFYVYGQDVDPQKANLNETLERIETLPNILNKFKEMNVCSGLGKVNIDHLPPNTVFQGIQQWHSKDCSLLFKKRRCDSCTKMRNRVQSRIARNKDCSKNGTIFPRSPSNFAHRCNLVALRLKCRRQRYQNNRAKEYEKHLISCLREQEERITNMQKAILGEKCSALNVLTAQ